MHSLAGADLRRVAVPLLQILKKGMDATPGGKEESMVGCAPTLPAWHALHALF